MPTYVPTPNMALDLPLCIQGQDYSYTFQYVDPRTLVGIDITGWSLSMQIRRSYELSVDCTPTVSTVSPATDGNINISIPSATTAALSPGRYQYDLFYTDTLGKKIPLLKGGFVVVGRLTAV